jgi:hypothetical protein
MTEPVSTSAAAMLAASSVAIPVLTIAGISLGLRADVLLAGFAGSVAAMALLNSVPSSGDGARELLRTTAKRLGVAVGSSVTAAYIAPLVALINNVPDPLILSVAFIAGAGAMRILPFIIERFSRKPPSEGS